jgi:hypothetical protein
MRIEVPFGCQRTGLDVGYRLRLRSEAVLFGLLERVLGLGLE